VPAPAGAQPTSETQPLLELGIPPEQAEKALRYLRADGTANGALAARTRRLAQLASACGSLQNAKLAYSLASRSREELDDQEVALLSVSLSCCECIPAAVRLWKSAVESGVCDETLLVTAARLGGDGTETVRLLKLLGAHPEQAELVAGLVRQLAAPGWHAEGSWGALPDLNRELVWWDFARADKRVPFGMSLTSDPISLAGKVGTRFRFQARWEITGVTDRCHLEITRDGGRKWDKLARYEGVRDWSTQEVDLQDYDGQTVSLRFHVLSGGQRQGRGFEMSAPTLSTVPVTRRLKVGFPQLEAGWLRRNSEDRSEAISGHQSESPIESARLALPEMECPTLTLEGRLIASSVYAKAAIEVEGSEGLQQALEVPAGSDWKTLRLPLTCGQDISLRLSARFNPRKDDDGLWARKLMVQGGEPGGRQTIPLDGGGEDGDKERLGLLQLLADDDWDRLRDLAVLRRGLSSLRSALALLPLVKAPEHAAVLLQLFSRLKEEAIPSFRLLTESAGSGEDLSLQTQVLLAAGLPFYLSTRDHLGDGLVTPGEFEENCRIYLAMRELWSEETARSGLGLLMTPIAGESLTERVELFKTLLPQYPNAVDFFAAWDQAWI
jgi:hypothetical protein